VRLATQQGLMLGVLPLLPRLLGLALRYKDDFVISTILYTGKMIPVIN
jgi:hypothetical protein